MIARLNMLTPTRPQTRGECANGPRPCPWVSCRYHLLLTVMGGGALRLDHGHDDPGQLAESCALDVADRGGITLEEVGEILSLTRERIRQIERGGLVRLRRSGALADATWIGWTR